MIKVERAAPLVLLLLSCAPEPSVTITDVTVIDPATGSRREHATISFPGPRTETVDGRGRFLIPGLWDMHAHVWRPSELPRLVDQGVTGVRSMGGRMLELRKWRSQIEAGEMRGPRIVLSSPLLDGISPPRTSPSIRIGSEAEAVSAVRGIANSGAQFIKVYDGLPRAAFFAIAAEAKQLGLPFAGHVPDSVTAIEASDAGIASIEHLDGVTMEMIPALAANRTWQTPTLVSQPDLERAGAMVAAMSRAGVPLLAGTDSADRTVHDEMELLVRAGLTPLQALRTATTDATAFLRTTSNDDYVLLTADPLLDIRNTRRIDTVIAAGRVYRI